jgi:hypothetical protein
LEHLSSLSRDSTVTDRVSDRGQSLIGGQGEGIFDSQCEKLINNHCFDDPSKTQILIGHGPNRIEFAQLSCLELDRRK